MVRIHAYYISSLLPQVVPRKHSFGFPQISPLPLASVPKPEYTNTQSVLPLRPQNYKDGYGAYHKITIFVFYVLLAIKDFALACPVTQNMYDYSS